MNNNEVSQITLQNLKSKIKTKDHLYGFLSQIYRLPSLTCKGVTVNYLKAYLELSCPVFRIYRKDFHPPYVAVKHFTISEIFLHVEELLKMKKEKPTGMTLTNLPDMEWILGVYHFLSPSDEMNLFPRSVRPESQIQLKIDPE